MIPFKHNSRKHKLNYNDRKICSCPWMGEGRKGTDHKNAQKMLGSDGYTHYFDHGDGFMEAYNICVRVSIYIKQFTVCQLYHLKK